jgi:hypothetical protein
MRSTRRWLLMLAPVLLTPAVLGGCSAIPGSPTAKLDSSPGTGGQAGQSWVVVAQGSATPSASTRGVAPSPTASPSSGLLALSTSTPTPTPTLTPVPNCTGFQRQGQINGLTAVPGAGAASVTWYNPGGDNLTSYRLTAIPQHLVSGAQAALRWKSIVPQRMCGMMTATITGLTKGRPYVLSLDAVILRKSSDGKVGFTVARSGVVYPT